MRFHVQLFKAFWGQMNLQKSPIEEQYTPLEKNKWGKGEVNNGRA
jgi:hypothetical protein